MGCFGSETPGAELKDVAIDLQIFARSIPVGDSDKVGESMMSRPRAGLRRRGQRERKKKRLHGESTFLPNFSSAESSRYARLLRRRSVLRTRRNVSKLVMLIRAALSSILLSRRSEAREELQRCCLEFREER
jgi:hypothetical protein